MEYITLNNGVKMPILGYGVYQIPDLKECERCVADAIDSGYRAIDTAQIYGNEAAVGAAVTKSGISREEFFLTTKIWISNAGEKQAAASIEESLKKLQTGYIDLLLIHQPFNDYYGSYRAMEAACRAGKVRALGVSNFYPDRLADLCHFAGIKPSVNQVETHVFCQQTEAAAVMKKYGVQIESWGPLAEGRNDFFHNETLANLGANYGKSVAQVALRYLIQRGIAVIPKSTHKERMAENFDIFDFSLNEQEMAQIARLDQGQSLFFDHRDPAAVEQLSNFTLR